MMTCPIFLISLNAIPGRVQARDIAATTSKCPDHFASPIAALQVHLTRKDYLSEEEVTHDRSFGTRSHTQDAR